MAGSAALGAAWLVGRAVSAASAGREPARTLPSPGRIECSPRLDVLVPARDEAVALPALLEDLGRQDHRDAIGLPRFSVVVIDDRSTDGTAAVAAEAAARAGLGSAARVVRRPPSSTPDGKGAALAFVPLGELSGDAVVVLDADARIGPDFLRRVAARLETGSVAFTARRRVRHADQSCLAAAQSVEQAFDGRQLQLRIAAGGTGELRGNGMVIAHPALVAAGGWPAGSLTEDLDLSTRLAARGITVEWAGELVAWEAPTATFRALWRQRLRWAEGSTRRFLALLPAALASARLTTAARIDLVAYASQLVLMPALAGAVAGALRRRRPRMALALLGGMFGAAGRLAWLGTLEEEATLDGSRTCREHISRAVAGTALLCTWVVLLPVALARTALRRGPIAYARTRDKLL